VAYSALMCQYCGRTTRRMRNADCVDCA